MSTHASGIHAGLGDGARLFLRMHLHTGITYQVAGLCAHYVATQHKPESWAYMSLHQLCDVHVAYVCDQNGNAIKWPWKAEPTHVRFAPIYTRLAALEADAAAMQRRRRST